MKKSLLLTLSVVLLALTSQAQSVSGILLNNLTEEPIAFAVLQLKNGETVIDQSVSDEEGYFSLSKTGTQNVFSILLSSVATGKIVLDTVDFSENKDIVLNTISVKPTVNQLKAFTVKGSIGVTKIEPQKIKYRTADLVSQTGGTAGDILKNMPSVTMGGSPNHNRDIRTVGLVMATQLYL